MTFLVESISEEGIDNAHRIVYNTGMIKITS